MTTGLCVGSSVPALFEMRFRRCAPEIVQERDLVLLHRVEARRAQPQRRLTPAVDLARRRAPEDLVEHGVGLR